MVTLVGEARMPENPSNPISLIKAMLLGVVCAALIYALYFLRFLLDDKINNPDDVERYLGLTLLGAIPNKNATKAKYGYRGYRKNGYKNFGYKTYGDRSYGARK